MNGWKAASDGAPLQALRPSERLSVQGMLLTSASAGAHGLYDAFRIRVRVTAARDEAAAQPEPEPERDLEPEREPQREPELEYKQPQLEECTICVDTAASAANARLLTVPGARKLLGVGASVLAVGVASCDDLGGLVLHASHIRLVGVVPDPAHVRRCLQLASSDAAALFCGDVEASATAVTTSLCSALRPCTMQRCSNLQQLPEVHDKAVTVVKNKDLLELCKEIRAAQGWSKKKRAPRPPAAAAWEAVLRLEQQWGAADRDGMPACLLAENESKTLQVEDLELHELDPVHNLPQALPQSEEARRRLYVDERKRPQVLWMIAMIRRLMGLHLKSPSSKTLHLVDVGGGRGDLALGVAQTFAERARVSVLDVNVSSLEAGRGRAAASGLTNIAFYECDIDDKQAVARFCNTGPDLADASSLPIDVVFGLHCCGGLTEAALELALSSGAAFAICSCCFLSNPHLASLSTEADQIAAMAPPTSSTAVDGSASSMYSSAAAHKSDRLLACGLAQNEGNQAQPRAMRAVNAARLQVCENRSERQENPMIGWLDTLPSKSTQNSVLCGCMYQPKCN